MTQPDWLKRAGQCIEHGHTLVCLLETKTHALIKFPGHTYWSGRGQRTYAKVSYWVIKKGELILNAEEVGQGRTNVELRSKLTKALIAKTEGDIAITVHEGWMR